MLRQFRWLHPLGLAALPSCVDLEDFSTSGTQAYCGTIALSSEFRDGFGPRVQMKLTVDLAARTGTLGTFEPAPDGQSAKRLFDNAALRSPAALDADALSTLTLDSGRDVNWVTYVSASAPEDGAAVAILSFRESDSAEVRLLWPGNATPSDRFALFSLQKREAGCSF